MAAVGAPFGRAGGAVSKLPRLDRPGRKLRHVMDADLRTHSLGDESDDVGGRYPRCTEAGGDVGGPEVRRLHGLESNDIAHEVRIERRSGFRRFQPVADRPGEIGVGRLPGPVRRVAEDGVSKLRDDVFDGPMQQFGDMIEIDMAAFVEHHGKRVGGRRDNRRRRRRDHPLCEDRSGFCRVRLEVVLLDRGDKPAVGIVAEGDEVRLAERLAHLAGLGILAA